MKIDLVLQGPIYPYTKDIINHYLLLDFVNKIIVSCWDTCIINFEESNKVQLIKNSYNDVPKLGGGNVNLQIQTSKVGILHTTKDIVVKIRTDQQFCLEDIINMKTTFENSYQTNYKFLDGSGPKGKIFTTGMFPDFPYHPRDHLFWGFREDLQKFFDIPFSPQDNLYNNFNKAIRAETYLGANYFKNFNNDVKKHIDNFDEYLLDKSTKRQEALDCYEKNVDNIFGLFARSRLIWKKYGLNNYKLLGYPHIYKEYWGEWVLN